MTKLSHLDEAGAARMVDVTAKPDSSREAVAEGFIAMSPDAFAAVRDGSGPKGDVLATARIAGIMGAKRTADLIPLCHPLPIGSVEIAFTLGENRIAVRATVRTYGKTGVEMEALTAVSVTLLTIYDMAKAVDKAMEIGPVRLLTKSGGKSGDWNRD